MEMQFHEAKRKWKFSHSLNGAHQRAYYTYIRAVAEFKLTLKSNHCVLVIQFRFHSVRFSIYSVAGFYLFFSMSIKLDIHS